MIVPLLHKQVQRSVDTWQEDEMQNPEMYLVSCIQQIVLFHLPELRLVNIYRSIPQVHPDSLDSLHCSVKTKKYIDELKT